MTIDPRLVLQMLAVAEHGSISRAAAATGISQPALSNSIAALERRLGVRVLQRSRQGSRLTEYGVLVSRCASGLESLITNMMAEVRSRAAGTSGPLTIGVTPVAAAILVPDAVALLMRDVPNISLTVIEGTDDDLLDLLLKGRIDLSVGPVGVDAAPPSVLERSLVADPFALVMQPKHRLAGRNMVSLSELAGEPWILPDTGSAYRRHVEAIFLTAGQPIPTNSVNTNSRAMFEELLLRTDRIALMPRQLFTRSGAPKITWVALKEAGKPRQIGVKMLRGVQLSPAANALLAKLQQASSRKDGSAHTPAHAGKRTSRKR